MQNIEEIIKSLSKFTPEKVEGGYKLHYRNSKPELLSFAVRVEKMIFPTREGELIEDVTKLPLDKDYFLTYPGTASTKSMVLFTNSLDGIFIGSDPTVEFAKVGVRYLGDNAVNISYFSREHSLYFIPFKEDWRLGADQYKKLAGITNVPHPPRKPKYFFQRCDAQKGEWRIFDWLNPTYAFVLFKVF